MHLPKQLPNETFLVLKPLITIILNLPAFPNLARVKESVRREITQDMTLFTPDKYDD